MGITKCEKCGEAYGDFELVHGAHGCHGSGDVVEKILKVLGNRAGFDGWWDDIAEPIKTEIVEELIGVVAGLQVIPEVEETEIVYGRIARKEAKKCIHGVSLATEPGCVACRHYEGPIEDGFIQRYGRIFRIDPQACIHGVLLGGHCHACPQCKCRHLGKELT